MVTRNGNLCSLSYKDWRLLIGKKERLTNEQKSKEDILKQVKLLVIFHQRVYVEPQNQEFRMHNEKTYSLVKRKDMQSATTFDKTKCATTSKVTMKINFLVKSIDLFSLLICISYRLWCMKRK
ncbi:hypothetical protein ZEAMMB73_Zm00001d004645, partial [Zea mays]